MDHIYKPEELASIRRESGLSQIDVVRATGISQALLSRYETGNAAPTLAAAITLADFYSVPYSDFVDRIYPRVEIDEVA